MNKLALLIIAVVAAAALFHFRNEQREQLRRMQAAEAALAESSARAEYAEQRHVSLRNELVRIQAEKLSRPAVPEPVTSKVASEPAGAKLLRDPQLRGVMKKEQLKAMERTASHVLNSNLMAALQLNPEQTATLKALVLKKYEPDSELMMTLLSGTASDAELAQIARTARGQRDAIDAEIRALLGNEGFAAFWWHEDSLAERARLADYRGKFAESGAPLSAEQEEALLHAMYEERSNFRFTHDFHNPSNFDPTRLAEIYSEENLNRFIEEMEHLNNNIILRAQSILGTEQAGHFAQFHRDQFERSKMTIKMTNALFPVRRRN